LKEISCIQSCHNPVTSNIALKNERSELKRALLYQVVSIWLFVGTEQGAQEGDSNSSATLLLHFLHWLPQECPAQQRNNARLRLHHVTPQSASTAGTPVSGGQINYRDETFFIVQTLSN